MSETETAIDIANEKRRKVLIEFCGGLGVPLGNVFIKGRTCVHRKHLSPPRVSTYVMSVVNTKHGGYCLKIGRTSNLLRRFHQNNAQELLFALPVDCEQDLLAYCRRECTDKSYGREFFPYSQYILHAIQTFFTTHPLW